MNGRLTPEAAVAVVWFIAFLVGILCSVSGAAALFVQRLFQRDWVRWSWCVIALLPTTLIAIDLFDRGPIFLDGVALVVWKPSLLLLFLAVQLLLFSSARGGTSQRSARRFTATATIWMLAVTAWSSHLFYAAIAVREENLTPVGGPVAPVREVTELVAFTDKNRSIRLLTPLDDDQGDAPQVPFEAFSEMVILQAPADFHSNCHGWVFSDGKFVVLGIDVEIILQDNGYEQVDEPREDDLIVYRNQFGFIIHTGVVRLVGHDGLVLVESKWGGLGRYLHRPETQVYAQDFSYYRSSRDGHMLHFQRPSPASGAPRPQLNILAQRANEKSCSSLPPHCKHVGPVGATGFRLP